MKIIYDQPKINRPYPSTEITELQLLNAEATNTQMSPEELTMKLLRTGSETNLDKFITCDPQMITMKVNVEKIIALPYNRLAPVLITGPSGTGKEIIAKAFKVPEQPFVARNCAAFPKELLASLLFGHLKGTFTGATEDRHGIFVQAAHGVVFLDEIGELSLEAQAMLLRTLQERTVVRLGEVKETEINCRIIAATKYNLRRMVSNQEFREDLFARLMAFEVELTPLLSRVPDIALIAAKGLDLTGNPMNYTASILLHDLELQEPTAIHKDIEQFNVRAIQAYVTRMRTYGRY